MHQATHTIAPPPIDAPEPSTRRQEPPVSSASKNGLDTCVFVCGCGHSGTTIITRILAAHQNVYCPNFETEIFLKKNHADMRANFATLAQSAQNQNRSVLLEKTPRHIKHLDVIRRFVPNARFVLMVRDGRDVVASFKRRMPGGLQTGKQRWLTANSIVLSQQSRHDVLVVRYEDFIKDPKETVAALTRFCGLTFDPRLLDYHRETQHWFGQKRIRKGNGNNGFEHDALRNWQVNQPIFDGRGRWKTDLTNEELNDFMTSDALPLMKAFGYV